MAVAKTPRRHPAQVVEPFGGWNRGFTVAICSVSTTRITRKAKEEERTWKLKT